MSASGGSGGFFALSSVIISGAMGERLQFILYWLFGPEPSYVPSSAPISLMEGPPKDLARPTHLWPRWLFLRALGLIYFSAFYSLLFQIKGLIGPSGILPASDYLLAVANYMHAYRFWYAPSLLWISSSDRMLMLTCWIGLIASILLVLNLWPRGMLLICFVMYVSFVAVAQDFSGYQSDGMLLSAGFIGIFFAPPGFRPGLRRTHPPSRASLFLLQMVWFTIYFESGMAKMLSGDRSWRNLTAMDDYYQNGPLPTWIGWYAQQMPHRFHAATAGLTLFTELFLVWLLFLPRRFRMICFWIVTPFQLGIIITANYTFLNYLVLCLGILLLDDKYLAPVFERNSLQFWAKGRKVSTQAAEAPSWTASHSDSSSTAVTRLSRWRDKLAPVRLAVPAVLLSLVGYTMFALLISMPLPGLPLPQWPLRALDPFRIANRYGLFAVMTHQRNEIEFQGTRDGSVWVAYPFRYKPQDIYQAPGVYAPYQPRFDWNLWFASLGDWRQYPFVLYTEERLLRNDPDVLQLFAGNPFPGSPPTAVRTVIWQYWFTDLKTKRATGAWWRRELLGNYAPALAVGSDGKVGVINAPAGGPRPSP